MSDDEMWFDRYVPLLAAELALRGVDLPEDTLAAMVEHNAATVASLAGISRRDAQLTINTDAVPAWAELIAQAFTDDEEEAMALRGPMATAAKVAVALSQCLQLLEASLEHHRTAPSHGAGAVAGGGDDAEVVESLLLRRERTRRLSRYLATVIADTAFSAGDVLLDADFHAAAVTTFTEILDGGEAERYDRQGPGRYCGDLQHPHAPAPEGSLPCGHLLHSLTGILAVTLTELAANHIRPLETRHYTAHPAGGDGPASLSEPARD